jgi:hypothetical protein
MIRYRLAQPTHDPTKNYPGWVASKYTCGLVRGQLYLVPIFSNIFSSFREHRLGGGTRHTSVSGFGVCAVYVPTSPQSQTDKYFTRQASPKQQASA